MGSGSAKALIGSLASGGGGKALIGKQASGTSTTVAGKLAGAGFSGAPKWKRAMEPGELKPGTNKQAKNTVVMTPGKGDKAVAMKVTSKTPKVMRGGKVNP